MNILITGGSGFLGGAVLSRIALRPEYEKIYLLIRPSTRKGAGARLRELVGKLFPPEHQAAVLAKVHAIPGDLVLPHLGLNSRDRWEILEKVQQILHVGASTDFGAPLAESRQYNVEGTRKILELAEACARQGTFERLDYISTAFVSGDAAGEVEESQLSRGQTFANNYEQSKYEAECLVREFMKRLPIAIHRPSIVVGDSRNGFTPHFKVLYWPLRLLSKNLLPFVAFSANARLDIVPVDFVADALVALMADEAALGKTFHITAGKGQEVRLGQVLRDAEKYAHIQRRPRIPVWLLNVIRLTPLKRLFRDEVWQTIDLASPYASYLRGTGVRFNAKSTHEHLARLGVQAPDWRSYKIKVLSFCSDSCWGKRLAAPEYSYHFQAEA